MHSESYDHEKGFRTCNSGNDSMKGTMTDKAVMKQRQKIGLGNQAICFSRVAKAASAMSTNTDARILAE